MNTIADRFKSIRLENKLNQKQFAQKLQISQNHISSLETGTRTLTTRLVKDVCREFNINENWLITGKDVKTNSIKHKEINIIDTTNDIEKLTEALATISLSENKSLHELIINLSKMNKNQINILYNISKQLPSKLIEDRILTLINQYIHSLLKDQ